ncbi:MAG: phosphoribosylanthranilate isomerase [Hyphomicrobiales bacterium]|jgi:phosphoribosylanthranilate isomerase
MSTVDVKICGLSEPQTLEAALGAGADMIGFVNFQKSPRHAELSMMEALAKQARGRAQIVILTVNATDAHFDTLNEVVKPDWWQLHGTEDADRIKAVQNQFGLPVIKALGVGSAEDVTQANALVGIPDRLLLDAKPPKDATRPGGLGAVFDWSLLDTLDRSQPFMLSGGLTPSNVGAAIVATGAPSVDVSSGVESAPGLKDAALIEQFVAAAKAASEDANTRISA